MKKILLTLLILAFTSPAVAGTWCEWDGSEGVNCQSDSKGYIVVSNGFKVRTESIANGHGYYELTTTQPYIGDNQRRGDAIWAKVGNQLTRTYDVVDLTTEELDEREAGAMPLSEYYLWKALLAKGVITQQEAANALPQELIDAYQARKRILGD